jgi:hypothetical protein
MRQSPRFPAGFFGACTAIPSERDRRFERQIENEGQMQLMCPSEIKARQSAKIRQLAEAAKLIGLQTLDEQAEAFGIPRSTAWTIRNGGHKASGLSVSIIDRMLSAPKLPPSVRTTLLEYIAEKTSGLYGGKERQRRLFCARLKDTNITHPMAQLPCLLATNGKR